ncbi:MAG: glycosyltransferase family 2 protein [Candidatus Omnitrophota bacterium]
MNEHKKEKICAIVVTYNRKELLKGCLDAILAQTYPVESIFLIDNASNDGTPEFLKENGYIEEITKTANKPLENENTLCMSEQNGEVRLYYVRMHENTGGAGGFYEGMKRGYEKDHDRLWLMDDDVVPRKDCLAGLINESRKQDDCLIISPVKIWPDGTVTGAVMNYNLRNPFTRKFEYFKTTERDLVNYPEYLEVHDVPFEGPLIKKQAIQLAGYPLKSFFIRFDDLEFCIRVRKFGKIILCPRAVIEKKTPTNHVANASQLRKDWYCYYRNLTFIDRLHGGNVFVRYLRPILHLMKVILKMIVKARFKNLKVILLAFYDGYFLKLDEKRFY